MIAKEQVQAVLDRVRPFLNADGGDIELVAVKGTPRGGPADAACAPGARART